MAFVWKALGMGGPTVPNFEFTFELSDIAFDLSVTVPHWKVLRGTQNDDNKTPVRIFTCDSKSESAESYQLAKNAMMKARTVKVPGLLKCVDAAEHNGCIYIATEVCEPMSAVNTAKGAFLDYYGSDGIEEGAEIDCSEDAKEEKCANGIAWGLNCVGTTIRNLHGANLVHSNVHQGSVFLTEGGEWRLFGLEFLQPVGELVTAAHCIRDVCRPPETTSGPTTGCQYPVDSYGLGVLMTEALTGPIARPEDVKPQAKTLPRSAQAAIAGLLTANTKTRWTVDRFLTDCSHVSDNAAVASLLEVEELSLKDPADRDAVYRRLCNLKDAFPTRLCSRSVLKKLSTAVQFGGSSATALDPLLQLGSGLPPKEFTEAVTPGVVALFSSQEMLIRSKLLQNAQLYVSKLPLDVINDRIWPQYNQGFTHKSPEIREQTARALIHFAPFLHETTLSGDVVKGLHGLQTDREGPIRTNATVCLGLISKHIPEASRSKVLTNGFCRMLKDSFHPSRIAAVNSMRANIDQFDMAQIATVIIPAVSPLLVDAQQDVKTATLSCIKKALQRVQAGGEDNDAGAAVPASPASVAPSFTTPVRVDPESSFPSSEGRRTPPAATTAATLPKQRPKKINPTAPSDPSSAAPKPPTNSGWDDDFTVDDDDGGWGAKAGAGESAMTRSQGSTNSLGSSGGAQQRTAGRSMQLGSRKKGLGGVTKVE